MPPVIDKDKCTGCGTCADICPMDVFFGYKQGEIPEVKFGEECWHCNACVLDCPSEAIRLRIPLPAMMLYVDAVNSMGRDVRTTVAT
ncbi:MAG: ferredoxin family protein [Thermoanaerobacter sp.]|nr:ferredoxin family protein [Thermoanaerobacter sp.]